jgi:hypothetical protein
MVLSAAFIGLILYCVQQLGVTLGVGSQTILLVAYLISMRDGVLDSKEAQFSRAVRAVLNTGLMCIVLSGVGITLMHILAGESATVLAPAYLFKWLLIIVALVLTLISKDSTRSIIYGVAGGTWYALFLVHILAPVTTWLNLFTLYAVWLVGFVLCWEALAFLLRDRSGHPKAAVAVKMPIREIPQKVIPPPPAPLPAMPKKEIPPIPPPPVPKKEVPVAPAPPAPMPKKEIPPAPPVNPPTLQVPVIIPNRITPSPSNVVVSNSNTLPLQRDPFAVAPIVPQAAPSASPVPPVPPVTKPQEKVPNDPGSGLPTIQVMPKNPADLKK